MLTVPVALAIGAAGAVAGALGVALGLGGGILLVPFLTLGLGLSLKSAAAISLCTVIATSSAVAAARAGTHLINLRLGMFLEVATVAGGLLGGITAQLVSEHLLERLFAVTMVAVGTVMAASLTTKNAANQRLIDRTHRPVRHVIPRPVRDARGNLGRIWSIREHGGNGV